MSLLGWIAWAVLLLLQNASFTLVSRARNSGSLTYHGVAAIFSNATWFAGQFVITANIIKLIADSNWLGAVGMGAFYTVFTLTGSLGMHYISLHYLEKGKRKVGA